MGHMNWTAVLQNTLVNILGKIEAFSSWRFFFGWGDKFHLNLLYLVFSFFTLCRVVLQPQNKYAILHFWLGTTVQMWCEMAYLQIPALLTSLQLLVRSGYTICHGRIIWSLCWFKVNHLVFATTSDWWQSCLGHDIPFLVPDILVCSWHI